MFETCSDKLNEGVELAAYSWDGLESLFKRKGSSRVVVPIMSIHTNPKIYKDFVDCAENDDELILPPLPKEALLNYDLGDIRKQFLYDGHFDGLTFIDLDRDVEAKDKHIALEKKPVVIGNNDPFEEHGYHLPMDSDNIRARGLVYALKDSELGEDILTIPSLSYAFTGPYERGFCGTIKLEFETQKKLLMNYLRDVVEEVKPDKVIVITSHAHPNHLGAVQDAIDTLRETYRNTEFTKIFDFSLLSGLKMKNGEPFIIRGHASRNETSSIMAYLKTQGREKLCDLSRIVDGDEPNKVYRARNKAMSPMDYNRMGKTGVNGFGDNHPKYSSVEYGEEYNKTMLERAKRYILTGDETLLG
ncbi:MAG: hypothetical protein DRP15_00505 [Candidatus Aenigmatarchaeota archaeon]|nr:MAG: hypothetical protein DRP15_00505 [Candidatus Aenigmarchaeota archaeon]